MFLQVPARGAATAFSHRAVVENGTQKCAGYPPSLELWLSTIITLNTAAQPEARENNVLLAYMT